MYASGLIWSALQVVVKLVGTAEVRPPLPLPYNIQFFFALQSRADCSRCHCYRSPDLRLRNSERALPNSTTHRRSLDVPGSWAKLVVGFRNIPRASAKSQASNSMLLFVPTINPLDHLNLAMRRCRTESARTQ